MVRSLTPINGCRRTNRHGHEFVVATERTIRSRHQGLDDIGL